MLREAEYVFEKVDVMWRVLGLVLLAAVLFANGAVASHPFQGRCSNPKVLPEVLHEYGIRHLDYWVKNNDSILVGVAKTRMLHPPEYKVSIGSACWVEFAVEEWLKGKGSNKILVNVRINTYGRDVEAWRNLEYCPIEQGKTYIIYGRHIYSKYKTLPKEAFYIAYDEGDKWLCPPHEEIRLDDPIIQDIKVLVKENKPLVKESVK
ncbi:MAG: hypothetical protein MK052_11935 [Alphaproteobacteria bacterium]|nr:hypothetical protein [Alphaproteobacteria bacterium]